MFLISNLAILESTHILGLIGALFIGMILGLIGGGGSILTVPLLVYLLGYNPVVATAYSLFVVGTSSAAGVIQKAKKQLVDFKTGLSFVFPSFLAVYVSRRYIVPALPDELLNIGTFSISREMGLMVFFALIMFMSSMAMIFSRKKEPGPDHKKPPYYLVFLQGVIIGLVTGIIGAGGGFLYVPALVFWSGLPMKRAVGTSLVIIAFNSLVGFLGDVQTLEIEWSFLLLFSLMTIVGVLIGGLLSKRVSNKSLKKGFGWFTLAMSIYIVYRELF